MADSPLVTMLSGEENHFKGGKGDLKASYPQEENVLCLGSMVKMLGLLSQNKAQAR